MRYVINDDDFEDWYSILYQANKKNPDYGIQYVLEEMKKEIEPSIRPEAVESFFKNLETEK